MVEQATHNRQAIGSNPIGARFFLNQFCRSETNSISVLLGWRVLAGLSRFSWAVAFRIRVIPLSNSFANSRQKGKFPGFTPLYSLHRLVYFL